MRRNLLLLVAIAALVFSSTRVSAPVQAAPNKYDNFAACLATKHAKMYGANGCSHCEDQKALFQYSEKIPYVECLKPGTRQVTDECKSLGIKHTPTWVFSDGERHEGVMQLQDLGMKTGCKLP